MEQTFSLINEFLEGLFAYGPIWIYLALATASFIENIFPPFPGDFFTLAGGALAATGWLNIFMVFVVVYVGGIGSTMLVYYLGSRFGRDYFIRKDYRYFSAADIIKMDDWFQKRGGLILIFSRFVVGARAGLALVGGISNYSPIRFFSFSSISFWLFNGILLFGSYFFITNIETMIYYYRTYEKIVWPIVIVIAGILIIKKIRRIIRNGKKS